MRPKVTSAAVVLLVAVVGFVGRLFAQPANPFDQRPQAGSLESVLPNTVQNPTPPEIIAAWGSERFVDAQFGRDYDRRSVVRIGSNYALKADDTIRDVTVIGADLTIEGHVERNVLLVFGRAQLASTAIVDGDLVVIGGQTTIQSGARVDRNVVVVGGLLDAPPEFVPGGDHVVIDTRMLGGRLEGLFAWITRGLLLGRPIVPSLLWVWAAVGIFFIGYLVINLVFDESVDTSAGVLRDRPLSALLVGLVILLLVGPVCFLLAVSIVGIAIVPLVLCALLIAWILGKVAVTRWVGAGIIRPTDSESRMKTVAAFTVGFMLITLAYMVPLLGFVTWTMLGVLGLGASTLAVVAAYRRENPIPTPLPVAAAVSTPMVQGGAIMASSDVNATTLDQSGPINPATPAASAAVAMFPHARFWDRIAASVLDLILVVFAWQFFDARAPERVFFMLLIAYYVAFWTWKGTTVGGIICQLRVVRVDGTPLRFVDALVRGLSAIFSVIVVGLGFLWILKDRERQAWHDKIAGTYVVRVPRNWPI